MCVIMYPARQHVECPSSTTLAPNSLAIAFALALIFGVLYLLGGRRPVHLVDARPRWTSRHWRGLAFYVGLVLGAVGVSGPVDALVRGSMAMRTSQLVAPLVVVGPLVVLGAHW